MIAMSSSQYFRRTLRQVHLTLVYSSSRSVEENFRAVQHALQRMRALLPPLEESPVVDVPSSLLVPDEGVLSLPPRERDPALVAQEINGCKSLLLEIIRRAAYDWVLYRTHTKIAQRKMAEQAFTWLFVEDHRSVDGVERSASGKHITSFLAICQALDLDPDSVREHVRKLTPKNVMSVGRPAEYRRRETIPHSPEETSISLGDATLDAEWATLEGSDE